MQIYVDDPAFSCRGAMEHAAKQFAIAFLWASVLGYRLAWRKADGGKTITWIGATVAARSTNVEVSFPEDKCKELATKTSKCLLKTIIATRELRSLAGSIDFVAGIVRPLRPFLSPLWAALSSRKPSERGRSTTTRPLDRLPQGLIKVRQFKHAFAWMTAFLNRQRGTISRAANYNKQPTVRRRISVDASPWGIVDILYERDVPLSYFADDITTPPDSAQQQETQLSTHSGMD
jgi:hypothetical protein